MRFYQIRRLGNTILILTVILIVLSGCQHQTRSYLSVGVLNFDDLRIPTSHELVVDGSLRHNEVQFVLVPELRSSTRYSSITLSEFKGSGDFDFGASSTTETLCGLEARIWPLENKEDLPAVWGVFFRASNVFVSVTALSREEALFIARYMLGTNCDENA